MEGLTAPGSPQLTPYQFSSPTWLIESIYIVDLAESSQGRISLVKCGWDAYFSASHCNQSNEDALLGQAWVLSHPCDWMGWCPAHSNHRKWISHRKEFSLPEEREGDIYQGKQRSMDTNSGSNTIETQTVSSNEQFLGLQNRRGLWELIRTAWVEIVFSQREVYTVHDEVHNFPEIKSWVAAKWLK